MTRLALQQKETDREQEAYREDRDDRLDVEQEPERDPEQHRMRERGAEIGHASPHHETPDRPRGERRPDPAAKGAQDESPPSRAMPAVRRELLR